METLVDKSFTSFFDTVENTEARINSLQAKIKVYTEKLQADPTNQENIASIRVLTIELEKVQGKHSQLLTSSK